MNKSIVFVLIAALFTSCNPSKGKLDKITENQAETYSGYLSQGRRVVSLSFGALSTRLQQAIVEQGTDHAIAFCNIHALPLTDSLSQAMNVNISRTALRFRNPENAPEPLDEQMMKYFGQLELQVGRLPDTLVIDESGFYVYMAPILTLPACLQCHGLPETEINHQTISLVRSLYPDDKAIGFREGELRGMWKVRFGMQNADAQ